MREDLTGKVFGNLKVISYNENNKRWICECKCGNKTEVSGSNLRLGNTKSCGCSRNAEGIKRPRRVNIKGEYIGQLYVNDIDIDNYTENVLADNREKEDYCVEENTIQETENLRANKKDNKKHKKCKVYAM